MRKRRWENVSNVIDVHVYCVLLNVVVNHTTSSPFTRSFSSEFCVSGTRCLFILALNCETDDSQFLLKKKFSVR
jgi:hypothetical protein